jgi:hypothetical protein
MKPLRVGEFVIVDGRRWTVVNRKLWGGGPGDVSPGPTINTVSSGQGASYFVYSEDVKDGKVTKSYRGKMFHNGDDFRVIVSGS